MASALLVGFSQTFANTNTTLSCSFVNTSAYLQSSVGGQYSGKHATIGTAPNEAKLVWLQGTANAETVEGYTSVPGSLTVATGFMLNGSNIKLSLEFTGSTYSYYFNTSSRTYNMTMYFVFVVAP